MDTPVGSLLTPEEVKKRKQLVQDMMPKKRYFVKRYGKNAEKVMYGVATKNIKKDERKKIQQLTKRKIKEIINSSLEKYNL